MAWNLNLKNWKKETKWNMKNSSPWKLKNSIEITQYITLLTNSNFMCFKSIKSKCNGRQSSTPQSWTYFFAQAKCQKSNFVSSRDYLYQASSSNFNFQVLKEKKKLWSWSWSSWLETVFTGIDLNFWKVKLNIESFRYLTFQILNDCLENTKNWPIY